MKNRIIISIFVFIIMTIFIFPENRYFADFSADLFFPSNRDFSDTYSRSPFSVKIGGGYKINEKIRLWGSLSYLSKKGITPVLQESAKYREFYFAIGTGFKVDLSNRLYIVLKEGIALLNYKEEALGLENRGNALGFTVGNLFCYSLSDRVTLFQEISYLYAIDKVEGTNITMGGFRIGVGCRYGF